MTRAPKPKFEADLHVGRRTTARIRTSAFAQLVTQDQVLSVDVETLSRQGAGLSLRQLPRVGGEVVLSLRAWDIPGVVVWASGLSCGIVFATPAPAELVTAMARPTRNERYVRDFARARRRS